MNKENTFSPESVKFIGAFMSAWKDALMEYENDSQNIAIMKRYSSAAQWTEVMLAAPNQNHSTKSTDNKREGVLGRAIAKYDGSLERKYEWNKYDLLGVRRVSQLPNGLREKAQKESWLKFVEVAIEHENNDDVENEVWKLCQFRAKLKVLVFYDFAQKILNSAAKESNYSDRSFAEKVTKKEWLRKKIDLLGEIVKGANELLPKEEASFLLIVGSRTENNTILWRASEFQGLAFSDWPPVPINNWVSETAI
jgi:hypothetical protein